MKWTSARQAIHDAYATHLTSKGFEVNQTAPVRKPDFFPVLNSIHKTREVKREEKLAQFCPVGFYREDRTRKQVNNHQVCHAVEAGLIISAVEGLKEPFKSWAKWAYGPRTQEYLPEQARFFQWLDQDVSDKLASSERKYKDTTQQRIRDVVAYTVLDYRSYVVSERHLYPVSLIISRCKIHRQNWKRDFLPWHEQYWSCCDEYLDRWALVPVAEVLGRLREQDNP